MKKNRRPARIGFSASVEKLARDHAALVEERLRLNGEAGIGQASGCASSGKSWEWRSSSGRRVSIRNTPSASSRGRDLDARTVAVEEAEHTWSERERSARLMLADLHREKRAWRLASAICARSCATGNGRRRLQALRMAPEAHAAFPLIAVAPPAMPGPDRTDFLQRVAGRLADQRADLLEQWQVLLRVQDEWHTERRAGNSRIGNRRPVLARTRTSFNARVSGTSTPPRWNGGNDNRRLPSAAFAGRLAGAADRGEAAWECERITLLSDAKGAKRRRNCNCDDSVIWPGAVKFSAQEAEGLAAALSRCDDCRQYVWLLEGMPTMAERIGDEQCDMAAQDAGPGSGASGDCRRGANAAARSSG